MYSKEVQVTNQVGFICPPGNFFIQKANEFKSTILVEKEERRVTRRACSAFCPWVSPRALPST